MSLSVNSAGMSNKEKKMKQYIETLDRFRQVSSAYRYASVAFRREGDYKAFARAVHWFEVAQNESDKSEDNLRAISVNLGVKSVTKRASKRLM